jgi:hypothetical protein
MKTIYLIKSFAPFIFLPLAPGVVQLELMRQGVLAYGNGALLAVVVQVTFTLGIVFWLAHRVNLKNQTTKAKARAFLKMSCVSKKVFHNNEWVSFEQYLSDHHNVVVSHGMTPEEAKNWVQESEAYLRREARVIEKSQVGAL